jgi:hypothetical protein
MEVRARRIVVVDVQGKERAELKTAQGLGAGLSAGVEGSALILGDAQGVPRVELQAFRNGSLGLLLRDAQLRQRVDLGTGVDGSARLVLVDAQQKTRPELDVRPDGSSSLRLLDARWKEGLSLGVTELETIRGGVRERRPESCIVLFDKDGRVLWTAP